jgi:hypothetical protein
MTKFQIETARRFIIKKIGLNGYYKIQPAINRLEIIRKVVRQIYNGDKFILSGEELTSPLFLENYPLLSNIFHLLFNIKYLSCVVIFV